jgi:hypothetical protein
MFRHRGRALLLKLRAFAGLAQLQLHASRVCTPWPLCVCARGMGRTRALMILFGPGRQATFAACRCRQMPGLAAFTSRTNARHSSAVKLRSGPFVSFESRTPKPPSGRAATSTQLPPLEPE